MWHSKFRTFFLFLNSNPRRVETVTDHKFLETDPKTQEKIDFAHELHKNHHNQTDFPKYLFHFN